MQPITTVIDRIAANLTIMELLERYLRRQNAFPAAAIQWSFLPETPHLSTNYTPLVFNNFTEGFQSEFDLLSILL